MPANIAGTIHKPCVITLAMCSICKEREELRVNIVIVNQLWSISNSIYAPPGIVDFNHSSRQSLYGNFDANSRDVLSDKAGELKGHYRDNAFTTNTTDKEGWMGSKE